MKYSAEIKQLLSQLSLEEKAELSTGKDFWHLNGIERLDLPSIMVTDGPHGLRKQPEDADHLGLNDSVPATCFPAASGMASTWNPELIEQVGVALGKECRKEGVSVLLGPGVNIKRHPQGGRNFEYFSEDPYLSGEMATAWVNGVQSQHVGSSLKHYAVNNHEDGRMVVDAIVDERSLREIYLPAFEATVKQSQPWTIMCAYNKINGVYASEHNQLLTDILHDEWAYEGMMLTDWGACNDRVLGIKNGQALEMPSSGSFNTNKIIAAVNEGRLSIEVLDKSVAKVLNLIIKSRDYIQGRPDVSFDDNHALARTAAEQACVLLKNNDGLLPLNDTQNIAVLGEMAVKTRYQGSGSSQICPTQLEQPLEQIQTLLKDKGSVSYGQAYHLNNQADTALADEALQLAQAADKVILIIGLPEDYESEGFDRPHMCLPDAQLQLIAGLAPVYYKLVLVLQNGSPVEMPFVDQVPAIVEAYLGGQAGASALANILFGHVNPSGKLAETFPVAAADSASDPWFPGQLRQSQYREGIWVGYRFFDTAGVPVLFPFGHGLSYTQFEYSDLNITAPVGLSESGFSIKEGDQLTVAFTLKNVGEHDGAEVAQLYVGQEHSSVPRPAKELRGYAKVFLKAGQQQRVTVKLNRRDFAFWCTQDHRWVVESDSYQITVAASVSDVRLSQGIQLQGEQAVAARDTNLASYFTPEKRDFNDQVFTSLLARPIPEPLPAKPYHLNSVLQETAETWLGRQLIKVVNKSMLEMMGGEISGKEKKMMTGIIDGMTLRQILVMGGEKVNPKVMARLIHLMNKRWLKAIVSSDMESL